MYKEEINKYNNDIYKNIKEIEKHIIKINIILHDLEKLGYNEKDMYKIIDNIGIELYKMKKIKEK